MNPVNMPPATASFIDRLAHNMEAARSRKERRFSTGITHTAATAAEHEDFFAALGWAPARKDTP